MSFRASLRTSSLRRHRSAFSRTRALLTALALLAALPALPACTDSETRRSVNADRTINEVAADYRRAVATRSGESAERTVGELNALLGRIGSVEGSSDQQAAAALLGASIANAIAGIEMERARSLETTARQARAVVGNAALTAAALANVAEAQGRISVDGDRAFLQRQRSASEVALRAAQETARNLEGPVGDLMTRAGETRSTLAGLEQIAEDLRRQANASTPMLALPLVEQRALVQSEVRTVRAALALNDLTLSMMRPELDLANASLVANQGVIAAANSALGELDNFSSTLTSDAERSRAEGERLRRAANEALARLGEMQSTSLAPTYERALAAIDRAASNGRRASGDLGRAGSLMQIAAETTRGELFMQQAAAAEQEALLHQQLASAGNLFGGESAQRGAVEAATARRNEAVEAARTAFQAALEHFGRLNAEDPAVRRGRAAIEGSIALLEGRAPASAIEETGTGGIQTPASPFGAAAQFTFGPGFPSAEELTTAFVNLGTGIRETTELSRRAMAVTRRDREELVRSAFLLLEVAEPMLIAGIERFGDDPMRHVFTDEAEIAQSGNFDAREFRSADREGRQVLVAVNEAGETLDLEIIEINGAWYMLGDPLFGAIDRNQLIAMRQMSQVMQMAREAMQAAANDVAEQIRSGEIAAVSDIRSAFQQAIQRRMVDAAAGLAR